MPTRYCMLTRHCMPGYQHVVPIGTMPLCGAMITALHADPVLHAYPALHAGLPTCRPYRDDAPVRRDDNGVACRPGIACLPGIACRVTNMSSLSGRCPCAA